MKKILAIASALLVLGALLPAFGVTVTNADGTTFTVATLAETAAGVRDAAIQEDQSKLPTDQNREGYLSYVYDVARDGGSGTVAIGPALGDNVIVWSGIDQVYTPVTPATATNSLGILSAVDVLAAGTTLNAAGIDSLAAVVSAPVATTAASNQLNITWTGSTATQGVFLVHLKLIKGQ